MTDYKGDRQTSHLADSPTNQLASPTAKGHHISTRTIRV